MKLSYYSLYCASALTLISQSAFGAGDLSIDLSLFYGSKSKSSESDSGATTKTSFSDQFIHGGACYFLGANVCLGLKYISYEQETTVSSQSGGGSSSSESTSTDKWTGTGVTVGYQHNEINARATYLVDANYANGSTDFYGGTSYQVDLGYGFKVKSTMIGPMLSYSKFAYTKMKTGSVESSLTNDLSDEFISPSLAIWLAL